MKRFSFCESALATSASPWHIRELTGAGRKLHGGIDTSSLCGRVKSTSIGFGGWDLLMPIEQVHIERGIVCAKCVELYKQGDRINMSAAELEEMIEKDPLVKAIVEDRIQDVAEGRTSRWTRLGKLGFEIKPKDKS